MAWMISRIEFCSPPGVSSSRSTAVAPVWLACSMPRFTYPALTWWIIWSSLTSTTLGEAPARKMVGQSAHAATASARATRERAGPDFMPSFLQGRGGGGSVPQFGRLRGFSVEGARLRGKLRFEVIGDRQREQAERPAIIVFLETGLRQDILFDFSHRSALAVRQPLEFASLSFGVAEFSQHHGEQGVRARVVVVFLQGLLQVLRRFVVLREIPQARAQVEGKIRIARILFVGAPEILQGIGVPPTMGLHDPQVAPHFIERHLAGKRFEVIFSRLQVAQEELVHPQAEKRLLVVPIGIADFSEPFDGACVVLPVKIKPAQLEGSPVVRGVQPVGFAQET